MQIDLQLQKREIAYLQNNTQTSLTIRKGIKFYGETTESTFEYCNLQLRHCRGSGSLAFLF